jgi:hypothetical protein
MANISNFDVSDEFLSTMPLPGNKHIASICLVQRLLQRCQVVCSITVQLTWERYKLDFVCKSIREYFVFSY